MGERDVPRSENDRRNSCGMEERSVGAVVCRLKCRIEVNRMEGFGEYTARQTLGRNEIAGGLHDGGTYNDVVILQAQTSTKLSNRCLVTFSGKKAAVDFNRRLRGNDVDRETTRDAPHIESAEPRLG